MMERKLSISPVLLNPTGSRPSTAATAATAPTPTSSRPSTASATSAATLAMPEVAESIANNPKEWENYWHGRTRSAPIKGLSPYDHLLIVRLFREPQCLPGAVLEFCRQELGEEAVQPRTTNLKQILHGSTCATPIVLFAEPGSSIDISPLARAHSRRVERVPMGGKHEGATAMAAIHSAAKAGEWVLLEGIHLCGPFLSHLSRVMEDIVEAGEEVARKKDEQQMNQEMAKLEFNSATSPTNNVAPPPEAAVANTQLSESNVAGEDSEQLQTKKRRKRRGRRKSSNLNLQDAAAAMFVTEILKDKFRVRGPIHKSFRLWCVTRPIENHFPVSMLQESICVVIEAVTGLRSNCLQSLTTAPLSQREFWSIEREDKDEGTGSGSDGSDHHSGSDGDGGDNGEGHASTKNKGKGLRSTRLFELVWFHALSVSRGTFGALGFSGGPYVLTAGLELSLGVTEMEMVHDKVLEYNEKKNSTQKYATLNGISLLQDERKLTTLAGRLVTDIHYGGHVGDPEDRLILSALWELSRDAAVSLGQTAEEIGVHRTLDQHRMFVRSLAPEPVLPGLGTGAILGKLGVVVWWLGSLLALMCVLFVCLFCLFCLFILFVCLFGWLVVCLFGCLFVWLFVWLFVCLCCCVV